MRCEQCVLEDSGATLEVFLEKLSVCTECPMATGPGASPILVHLAKRAREAQRNIRSLSSKLRQKTNELQEIRQELGRYEERLAKVEALHRASSSELEEQIERARSADAARARLATILQATNDFVAIYTVELRAIFLNQSAREILGIAPNHPMSELGLRDFHGSFAEDLLSEAIPRAMEEGSWVGDSVIIARDGQQIPISQSIVAHRGSNGDVQYFSSIGRDITAYKEIDRLKSEFISTVSHELRTPLTAIRGSLGLLEGGLAGELPELAVEMIVIARENSERLIRLINDILDLEKMEAGKFVLKKSIIRVRSLLESAVRELDMAASAVGVNLIIDQVPDMDIFVDRDRILQVLVNLIGNAIKFSLVDGTIEIGANLRDEETLRIYVTDHGSGIAQKDLERLFRKFSQVDGSTTRAQGGSGLGLAICKAIVEEHGGTIGVVSEIGEGSTFSFELPTSID